MKIIDLPDYGVKVSESGDVFNLKSGRPLKPTACRVGYQRLSAMTTEGRKSFSVHRLVAMAFIPNPGNKPDVNHKDGNKANNHVSNLEWVTKSENSTHAYINGLFKHKRHKDSDRNKRMREMRMAGTPLKTIASTIGLSLTQTQDICRGYK